MARKPSGPEFGSPPVGSHGQWAPAGAASFPDAPSASDPIYHVDLGNTYLEMGSLDDAANSFRRAVALDPSLPEAHFNLGNVLADIGDAASAVESYRRAIEIAPRFFAAHFNLGDALTGFGNMILVTQSFPDGQGFSVIGSGVNIFLSRFT